MPVSGISVRNLRQFKPGQSGNPGGRPKAAFDVVEMARQMTPDAIMALGKALADPRTRVQAASVLLDRAWGKPLQTLATPDGNSPISLHLLATQFVGKQLLAEREEQPLPPTIQHESETTNGNAFDLNAPPPSE